MDKITRIRRSRKVMFALAVAGVVLLAMGYINTVFDFTDHINRALGRGSEPATQEDIKRLCERPPDYLADLPETTKETLRAAYEEGRRLQAEGCEARQAEKYQEAIDRWGRALDLAETDAQRAALRILRGNSYDSIGQYDKAEADYKEALKLADSISPPEESAIVRADALGNLGDICAARGDLDGAEGYYNRALEASRGFGDELREANQLGSLGNVYRLRGNLETAEQYYNLALHMHGDIGDRWGEAGDRENLGVIYEERGDFQKAEQNYNEALDTFTSLDDRQAQANVLGDLGAMEYARSSLDESESYFARALALHTAVGDRLGTAKDLGNLGTVYAQRSDLPQARTYLEQARSIYQEIGAGGEGPENVRQTLEKIDALERQREERGD